MGLKKDNILAIIPQFLNPMVVPEKKNVVFSFRPIDSIVFFKLEDVNSANKISPAY